MSKIIPKTPKKCHFLSKNDKFCHNFVTIGLPFLFSKVVVFSRKVVNPTVFLIIFLKPLLHLIPHFNISLIKSGSFHRKYTPSSVPTKLTRHPNINNLLLIFNNPGQSKPVISEICHA